jgi:Fic family protein
VEPTVGRAVPSNVLLPKAFAVLEADHKAGRLSIDTLQRVHEVVTDAGTPGRGAIRRIPVVVRLHGNVTFRPPAPHVSKLGTASLMLALREQLAKSRHGVEALLVAARILPQITELHPFVDGNGRVARAVAQWVLTRSGWEQRTAITLDDRLAAYCDETYRTLGSWRTDLWQWEELFFDSVAATYRYAP